MGLFPRNKEYWKIDKEVLAIEEFGDIEKIS